MAIHLALVLHAHQPAGNFDNVIEDSYRSAYLPFVEAAEARPWFRFSLHYSGFLLDWLAARHPEYIERLQALVATERLELLGGGYYEPILAAIPPEDQQEQIARLAASLRRHLNWRGWAGERSGAWLAERVWEPQMAAALAQAGIVHTLLDDSHFQAAGVAAGDLHGYWRTESEGMGLQVAPSNFELRQTIPFQPESVSFAYLEEQSERHPGSLITMGDDLEKFGSWPQTHQHVYTDGWLRRFLDGLEARADRICTVPLGAFLAAHPARGLIYLPTGSYPEMMQWAGNASWRGFFTKYREANLLHKTQWDLSRRLRLAPATPEREGAWSHVLAAECNDAYWHGWFGGLYSPHLRNVAFTHLLAADELLGQDMPPLRRLDFHGDGRETIEMRSPELRLLLNPADGGTIEEIDCRPVHANLVNSLQRRPEPYHEAIRQRLEHNPGHLPAGGVGGPEIAVSIAELNERLRYDPYPHAGARLYRCADRRRFSDYQRFSLEPDVAIATGAYEVVRAEPGRVELAVPAGRDGVARARKTITLSGASLGIEAAAPAGDGLMVLEIVFNLLAPNANDRCLEQAGTRLRLDWAGELAPEPMLLRDGWRGLTIRLEAPGAQAWWIEPLFTVSQSEQGFESLYQGSAFAGVWPAGAGAARLDVNFLLD